jgi:sugar lactone lactonase YvrE
MRSTPFSSAFVLAALLAALAGCGPGGPKPATENTGGSSGPTPGIALVAGNATLSGRADAKGADARFNTPRGIALDSGGNLYVADERNFAIRKIAPDGTVSTFAGVLGTIRTAGSGDGNGTRALFVGPTAIAIDAGNNLFVLDGYAIRKITPSGDVSTLTTLPSGSGFGSSIQFQPAGIAVDSNGDLLVTTSVDTRRLTAASSYRVSTTLESGLAFDYGQGVDVLAPRGVAVDTSDVGWLADLGNTISRVAAGGKVPIRFAGSQGTIGSANGAVGNARFGQVVALTTDKNGNLYAADAANFTIRKITSSAVTSTVAGIPGTNAFSTRGLPGTLTTLRGIVSDGGGNLYVTEGNAVAKITLP